MGTDRKKKQDGVNSTQVIAKRRANIRVMRSRNGLNRASLSDYLLVVALIFASAIVPLIVFLQTIELSGVLLETWRGSTEHVDFFNYWKAVSLIWTVVILLCIFIYKGVQESHSLEAPRIFFHLMAFNLLAIISALASTVPEIAFFGFTDRYEGLWILLAYSVLCYTAFIISKRAVAARIVIIAILCSSVLVAVLGLFQFLGYDFFQTDMGKRLILPAAYEHLMEQLSFNFGKNIMYTTLYNPNFLGSYAALLLPLAWGWTFFSAERSRSNNTFWRKPVWALGLLFSTSLFILWLGSMSRAGLLGGGTAMLLFFVIQFKSLLKNPIPLLLLLLFMVGSFLFMNNSSGGLVVEEFRQTLPSRIQQALGRTAVAEDTVPVAPEQGVQGDGVEAPEAIAPAIPLLREFSLNDNRLVFRTETETMQIVLNSNEMQNEFRFYDAQGRLLAFNQAVDEFGRHTFAEPMYESYSVSFGENVLNLFWHKHTFVFSIEAGALAYIPKPFTAWTEVNPAPYFGFVGLELFASSRGYIWSRTLPLLQHTILTGFGPDAFAAFFPQDDVAWKVNALDSPNIVVDKPHNWFLQTAINTGVFSLVLILWFLSVLVLGLFRVRFGRAAFGMNSLFGKPVKHISKGLPLAVKVDKGRFLDNRKADEMALLTGMLCGIIGYVFAGVFNDSVVSVAPIFWTIAGLGIGMLRPDREKNLAAAK